MIFTKEETDKFKEELNGSISDLYESELNKVYDTRQIACLLNVDIETVRRWLRAGKMKGTLDNGKKGGYLVRKLDLLDFVESNPKYHIQDSSDPRNNSYAVRKLDMRIYELEDIVNRLQRSLDELKKIRDTIR
jgi:hypothetical protein